MKRTKINNLKSIDNLPLPTSAEMADKTDTIKPYFSAEPYTDEELAKLEHTFLTSQSYGQNAAADFHRYRDATILKIACALGLRPTEALSLRWDRINWSSSEIYPHPYSNKNRQTAPVVMTEMAKNLLLRWRELFDQYIRCAWVFPSLLTFEPITTSAYGKRLRQISMEAKIYKILWYTEAGQPIGNKRFYSARKHFGTKVYHQTKDRDLLMRGLRQTRYSSGDRYVYSSKEQVKEGLDSVFKQ